VISSNDESPGEGQGSDYDGAWKEALRRHLKEFIDRCFPRLAILIDWTFEPEWLDKEISQIIGRSGRRNQEVDMLFRVRLIDGRDQWILCHLEVQSSYEADFVSRIDLYNSGLKWLFQQEVLTLVILADLKAQWRPSEYRFELAGYGSDRRFPICKVLDHLESDWADDASLVVEVARAQIAALRTANDPELRFNAKTQLVRNLYSAGYNQNEVREIFRLVDWMMHLRSDLDHRFKSELIAYEKELQMPYITSVERLAKEEGREEGWEKGLETGLERGLERGLEKGREQGSATLLLRILTQLCGPLPEEVEREVHQLPLTQSQALGDALLGFRTLDDVKNWLESSKQDRVSEQKSP
jgi:Domain of unknown function (DUF4351)